MCLRNTRIIIFAVTELINSRNNMGMLLGSGTTKPQYPYDMWYGVQGDTTSLDHNLTRVGNLDLHRTLPIQSKMKRFVENADGAVKYYLHQNDSRLKEGGANAIIDSTDGNVMLEIPEHYFRLEVSGTKWIYAISEYPLPGFVKIERKTIAPWYSTFDTTEDKAVSGCWLTWNGNDIARDSNGLIIFKSNATRYRGGNGNASYDGTYRSFLGMGRTAVAKSTVRAKCKGGTHHGAYRAYNTIAWLQRIEYASLHCQNTYNPALTAAGFHQGGLGSGVAIGGTDWSNYNGYYPFVPGGVTATLGNNTGKVSYVVKNWKDGNDITVQVTSYRGFEVPFEYLWLLADDVLVHHSPTAEDNLSVAYVCKNPSKFTSHSDSSPNVPDGYEAITNLPRAEGYIKTLGISTEGFSFPTAIGGGATTGACDYYWIPAAATASGWYGALLSCFSNLGSTAGFGMLYTSYRSSYTYAYSGFRLCRF